MWEDTRLSVPEALQTTLKSKQLEVASLEYPAIVF